MSEIQKYKVKGAWVDDPFVTFAHAEMVMFADHERCKQELLELLREWSGTGIADCHCWNTDLRKRTDAALEAK
jgi:hypothetical protein